MSKKVSLIQGKGDWQADPPTGASDHDLMHIINDFFEDGGVLDLVNGDFLVEQSDTPGMHVKVGAGTIYVPNSSWVKNSWEPKFYRVISDAEETGIAIASNASGQTRIDLICQKIDKITAPNDDADNVCPIVVVAGTPGSGAPAVPNDHEVLAEVEVADGETSITTAEITDRRRQIFVRPNIINHGIKTVEDGANVTFDSEDGKYTKFFVEVAGDRNLLFDNVPVGLPLTLFIKQGSGGDHDPVFPASGFVWGPYGQDPVWASSEGEYDVFVVEKLPDGTYLATQAIPSAS